MSAYKVIKTAFKVGESLEKALRDLGIQFEKGQSLKANGAILNTSWGRTYGGINQEVAFAIQQDEARRSGIGNMDGVGFRWNGSGYDLVQDHYDENNSHCADVMSRLKQRYTYHEVSRQARARGYSVRENKMTDGTIRLTLERR
jgi:hypothetical protein